MGNSHRGPQKSLAKPQVIDPPGNIKHQLIIQSSEGPLPNPELLAHYEAVLPGLADRIVAMAEAEGTHRHEMDKKVVDAQIDDVRDQRTIEQRGQWFGFGIGLAAFLTCYLTTRSGHPVTGGFIGTSGVAGLVSAFIIGRRDHERPKTQEKPAAGTDNADQE